MEEGLEEKEAWATISARTLVPHHRSALRVTVAQWTAVLRGHARLGSPASIANIHVLRVGAGLGPGGRTSVFGRTSRDNRRSAICRYDAPLS